MSYVELEAPESVMIKSKKDLKEKRQKSIDDIKQNKTYSLEDAFKKIEKM